MSDVVCVGIAVADAIGRPIDTIPEKARLQIFDELELHTGGCAVNTGIAMKKLGAEVAVIGKVGKDGFGDFLEAEMLKENVDVSGMVRDPETATSFTFVMVSSDGERRFLHTPGCNATLSIDDIDMKLATLGKILHVAGTCLMSTFDGEQTGELLAAARKAGCMTSLDTAYNDRIKDPMRLIEPALPHLDYFLPSIEEAQAMCGLSDHREMAHFFADRGCRNVVIKLGREGSFGLLDGEEISAPIYEVRTIDSSGAGDCFIAGFLMSILKGVNGEEALRFGAATAAQCVQAVGCTTGVPSYEDVLAFQSRYAKK